MYAAKTKSLLYTGLLLRMNGTNKLECLYPDRPFQPSLFLRVRPEPTQVEHLNSPLGSAPDLTHKHRAMFERPDKDKIL
jgi:hypothetical protein